MHVGAPCLRPGRLVHAPAEPAGRVWMCFLCALVVCYVGCSSSGACTHGLHRVAPPVLNSLLRIAGFSSASMNLTTKSARRSTTRRWRRRTTGRRRGCATRAAWAWPAGGTRTVRPSPAATCCASRPTLGASAGSCTPRATWPSSRRAANPTSLSYRLRLSWGALMGSCTPRATWPSSRRGGIPCPY